MFTAGEDGNLKLLTKEPAPKCLAPVYGQAPYLLANSSTSGGACSGLNPYVGPYHHVAKTTQGIPIGAPIFEPSARTSSSSTSAVSVDQDSTNDYPKIGGSTCWNSTVRVASSSWWPRLEHIHRIALADIPPSEDQKRPMLEHPMMQ
jgi:hypothetical protein